MTGRLVCTGQVLLDLVMRVPALPPVGGDVMASATSLLPGGGFTVMAAAARAGAAVVYAGGHGTGPYGDAVRTALAAEGISAAAAPTPDEDTGVCVVLVDDDGERTFVTGSGAEAGPLVPVPTGAGDVVHVSGYSLLADAKADALLDRVERGAGTVLVDPGPLVAEIDAGRWARLLRRTDVLSVNAREARLLTGSDELRVASAALAERVPVAIVRDGADGCLLTRDGRTEHVPGHRVTAMDTNGAGDAHCGVLAAALLDGADLRTAARRANVAAALAVTRPGPATAPTAAEVDALLPGARP